ARHVPRDARFVVATFQNIAKRYPWPFGRFERVAMTRADGWIAYGQTIQDTVGGRPGYAGKPSRVIPPGVDVAGFRADPIARGRTLDRLGWGPADRVVGYLGRFVPEKGLV